MARAVVADVGTDCLRRDALERIEGIYAGLGHGVPLQLAAGRLRAVADQLDGDPTDYLRRRLAQIEADARRALNRTDVLWPVEPNPQASGCQGPESRPGQTQQEEHP